MSLANSSTFRRNPPRGAFFIIREAQLTQEEEVEEIHTNLHTYPILFAENIVGILYSSCRLSSARSVCSVICG